MKTKRLQINYSDTNSYADQETKWVKINNQQEFELNLHQLGWSGNTYGYRFEYYAQTKDLSEVGQIAVTNTFTLNGDVVRGENKFTFKNVGSSQTIHVNGVCFHMTFLRTQPYGVSFVVLRKVGYGISF